MNLKNLAILICLFVSIPMVLTSAADEKEKEETEKGVDETIENGTVIFYRSRSMKGGAIRLNITGGDKGTVGLLRNGTKLVKKYPVGEYTFVVTSPSIAGRDDVTIDIKSGETYYVKGEALLGWPAARSRFTLMKEKKGKAESDKIKTK